MKIHQLALRALKNTQYLREGNLYPYMGLKDGNFITTFGDMFYAVQVCPTHMEIVAVDFVPIHNPPNSNLSGMPAKFADPSANSPAAINKRMMADHTRRKNNESQT